MRLAIDNEPRLKTGARGRTDIDMHERRRVHEIEVLAAAAFREA